MHRPRCLLFALILPLLASPARARPCDAAGSLVPNCGFDTDTTGWFFIADSVVHATDDCATGPGCVELDRDDGAIFAEAATFDCFPVEPLTGYAYGFSIRLESGTAALGCFATFIPYQNEACTIHIQDDSFILFTPAAQWTEHSGLVTTTADTVAARLEVRCGDFEDDFVMRVDDALVVATTIFVDGFETGDASRWTSSVP